MNDFQKWIKLGEGIENKNDGGFLVPEYMENDIFFIMDVKPVISELISELIDEGKVTEALAIAKLESGYSGNND